MKSHNIPELNFPQSCPNLVEVSSIIERQGSAVNIDKVNWKDFPYKPEVVLFSAYTKTEILLKYRVNESHILARHTFNNDPVFEDSCVEFFISSGNKFYYNFEFNCIGTSSVGYGQRREGRKVIDDRNVSAIRTYSTLGDRPLIIRKIEGPWELTIAIPFSMFREREFLFPGDHQFNANFYKCGDKLPVPHFLSWNPINTKNPDFHSPEYFGSIRFIKAECQTIC